MVLVIFVILGTLSCSKKKEPVYNREFSMDVSYDENGYKLTIVANGKIEGYLTADIFVDFSSTMYPINTGDKYFNRFSKLGDDRIIVKGRKVSSKSYCLEKPNTESDEMLVEAAFTVTEVEVLTVIKANEEGKKIKKKHIIKVLEKYAFKENSETGELELISGEHMYAYPIKFLIHDDECFMTLYSKAGNWLSSTALNEYFSEELENTWNNYYGS